MSQVHGVLDNPSSTMLFVKRPQWGLVWIMSMACIQRELLDRLAYVYYTLRT
jgi:hypothetical protein